LSGSLALSGGLALGLATQAHAMGSEPPADAAGAKEECKEADKAKCPPQTATKPTVASPDKVAPPCTETDKSKCPPQTATKPTGASPDKVAPPCTEADKSKCPGKQSFDDRYRAAVALIDGARYDEALAAMRELDDGSSADVVNYIGYLHRKLGKMAEAQMYYEAALHMKPDHRGALEYYGEWYCMMGNLDKARQNLARIAELYGTGTKEYAALAKMIDETAVQQKS
jgi:tetratricopeptide (TPR) repeat protein